MFPRDPKYTSNCIFIRTARGDVKQNLVEIFNAGEAGCGVIHLRSDMHDAAVTIFRAGPRRAPRRMRKSGRKPSEHFLHLINQEEVVAIQLELPVPISRAQLRRLQVLWRRWTGHLQLARSADRELRHYYVERFTQGRAKKTTDLTSLDAAQVIARLERLAGLAPAEYDRAAGTAGRHGFPERRGVPPTGAAWRALWTCVRELNMDRAQLDFFIRQHYASKNLRGLADIRTMADLNRVLWGLKAVSRRGPGPRRAAHPSTPKAA
jgi:hypothetical protein